MTPVISNKGLGYQARTRLTALLEADLEKAVGLASTPDNTVGLGADGDEIYGVLKHVDDVNGTGTVQIAGEVTLLYSGSAPVRGANIGLLLDGTGKVKAGASVKKYHVSELDTVATTVTFNLVG